jgi:hypothetical protein
MTLADQVKELEVKYTQMEVELQMAYKIIENWQNGHDEMLQKIASLEAQLKGKPLDPLIEALLDEDLQSSSGDDTTQF